MEIYDVVVIGGGVTGFSAAMYSGRFQLKTAVIGEKLGGTIILTDDIANWPGEKKITGMNLYKKIKEHALEYDVKVYEKKVIKISKMKDCFKIFLDDKNVVKSKTVIYATGTSYRKLGVPGEKEFFGKGVHNCALCDGFAYKDKVIAVIGGGDSSAKEALLLTQWAKKIYMIARGDELKAEPINLARIKADKKIEVITKTNVKEIKGEKFVNNIVLDKEFNGSKELKLDGVFIEIGHIPITDLAESLGVKLNNKKEIIIDRDSKTNIKGFFAAGDCVDSAFKQAITGSAEGVIASHSAYSYVTEGKFVCGWGDF